MSSNKKFKEVKIDCPNPGKTGLLKKLLDADIKMNEYAMEIFNSENFNIKNLPLTLTVIETEIRHIGLPEGGTFQKIKKAMRKINLEYCPVEVAPFIRLAYKNQKESKIKSIHENPPDSIVIFSKPLINNDDFPKGFYIRNYEGYHWLRAYKCSDDFLWKPNARMFFLKK